MFNRILFLPLYSSRVICLGSIQKDDILKNTKTQNNKKNPDFRSLFDVKQEQNHKFGVYSSVFFMLLYFAQRLKNTFFCSFCARVDYSRTITLLYFMVNSRETKKAKNLKIINQVRMYLINIFYCFETKKFNEENKKSFLFLMIPFNV